MDVWGREAGLVWFNGPVSREVRSGWELSGITSRQPLWAFHGRWLQNHQPSGADWRRKIREVGDGAGWKVCRRDRQKPGGQGGLVGPRSTAAPLPGTPGGPRPNTSDTAWAPRVPAQPLLRGQARNRAGKEAQGRLCQAGPELSVRPPPPRGARTPHSPAVPAPPRPGARASRAWEACPSFWLIKGPLRS